jgi:hypothetical protein
MIVRVAVDLPRDALAQPALGCGGHFTAIAEGGQLGWRTGREQAANCYQNDSDPRNNGAGQGSIGPPSA